MAYDEVQISLFKCTQHTNPQLRIAAHHCMKGDRQAMMAATFHAN